MLDLAKAFDSADLYLAWRILLIRGTPPKLVALLKTSLLIIIALYGLSWTLKMFI